MNEFISNSSFLAPVHITESAWLQHIPFAFWLVEKLQPKLIVELGVHTGSSYFAFCQSAKHNAVNCVCYGVDTWKGDEHAGFYSDQIYNAVNGFNQEHYSLFSYLVRSTFEEARGSFEENSIDLLHIDGYHTYEAVKNDFLEWRPKLSNNAVVLFHDIHVREREFGVYQLWSELRQEYPGFEFTFGHGLGVLGFGDELPLQVGELLQLTDPVRISEINSIYGRLGSAVITQQRLQDLAGRHQQFVNDNTMIRQRLEEQLDLLEKRDQHIKLLERTNTDMYLQVKSAESIKTELEEDIGRRTISAAEWDRERETLTHETALLNSELKAARDKVTLLEDELLYFQKEQSSLAEQLRQTTEQFAGSLKDEIATAQLLLTRLNEANTHLAEKDKIIAELSLKLAAEKERFANKGIMEVIRTRLKRTD